MNRTHWFDSSSPLMREFICDICGEGVTELHSVMSKIGDQPIFVCAKCKRKVRNQTNGMYDADHDYR